VKHIILILISVVMMNLVSCGSSQNAIPTMVHGTQIPLSTHTPVFPTNIPQPSSTSSSIPSLTSTNTLQPSSTPSVTPIPLSANGPWGVVQTDKGIWAFNADGEGLRQLTQEQTGGGLAISPSGGQVAYLAYYNSDAPNSEKVSLRLISLPDGKTRTISDVMLPAAFFATPTSGEASGSPTSGTGIAGSIQCSILDDGDWSPDGQRLAFTSCQDGLYSNLYIYDLRTGSITRMTNRPHYEYGVKWSPTGEYIFVSEAESVGGGGISGGSAQVIRADRPETAPVWGIPASDTTPESDIIDWISPDSLLLESYAQPCGIEQLSQVDIITGKIQTLWQASQWGDCIEHIMRDPVSGALLLNQTYPNQSTTDLHIALLASDGVKLKDVNAGDLRTYLLQGSYPDDLNLVGSAAAVSASLPETLIPIQSPNRGLWAWLPWPTWPMTEGDGLWIGNAGQPPIQIYSTQVDSFTWSLDGKTAFFCAGGSVYVASWPDFKPEVLNAVQESPLYAPYRVDVDWVLH